MQNKFLDCVLAMYIDLCSAIDHSTLYMLFIISSYFMNMRFCVMFEISMKHIYVTQLLFFFSFFFVFWFLILELSTINEFEKKKPCKSILCRKTS